MEVRYQSSSFVLCPLCNQKSYLTNTSPVTEEELSNFLSHAREALVLTRNHHAVGTQLTESCIVFFVLCIVFCIICLVIYTAPV